MSASRTTGSTGTTPGTGTTRSRRLLGAATLALVLAGCTSAPEPAVPVPSVASPTVSGSTTPSAAADAVTVDITLADGDVTPNGEKLDVRVGQPVVLNVTSDEADEIHAHTGGDGFELQVEAGVPATGTFTLDSAGSFEVESHHLEKVIVVLNAR